MVKSANSSGKTDRYGPYAKTHIQRKFQDRMEDIEAFFKSDVGKEYQERKQMGQNDVDTFSFEDYSPPCSPKSSIHDVSTDLLGVSQGDASNHGTHYAKREYERKCVGLRIKFANATKPFIGHKRAWALAFKKYPKNVSEPNHYPYSRENAVQQALIRYKKWEEQGATRVCENILNDFPELNDLI